MISYSQHDAAAIWRSLMQAQIARQYFCKSKRETPVPSDRSKVFSSEQYNALISAVGHKEAPKPSSTLPGKIHLEG